MEKTQLSLFRILARNFFSPNRSFTAGCGYFTDNNDRFQCVGCTEPDDYIACDRLEDDVIHSSDPGGGFLGYLVERLERCEGDQNFPGGPPTCNSCPNYLRDYWIASSSEICSPYGGIDDDCDGLIDEGFNVDGDGYETCEGDCDDTNPTIYPGAAEICDCENDNNCNGMDDENSTCQEALGMGPQCDEGVWNWCALPGGCCAVAGVCYPSSPIVIDINGNGFSLTNAANGVNFDLKPDGIKERLGWTSANSDDAWLALDRNGNGTIDDGRELFGNYTPQPRPTTIQPNGFIALAEFDKPENGGNSDGQIDRRDNVFSRLRLWRDTNHNGMSELNEMRRLSLSPIRVLELEYFESRRADQHGNRFRYRAVVRDERGAQVGRWAWDVFLVTQ